MPFYKFLLKTGHAGAGRAGELRIYIYEKSYTTAIKHVKQFPSVKHFSAAPVWSSSIVDEREYIIGIMNNGYKIQWGEEDSLSDFEAVYKRLSYIKNYTFQTEEGKTLKAFCDRYKQAKDKIKKQIIKEYVEWGHNLINDEAIATV